MSLQERQAQDLIPLINIENTLVNPISRSQHEQESPLKLLEKLNPFSKHPKITSLSPIVPSSITLPSEATFAMSPVGKLVYPKEVAPAVRAPSHDLKFGDGDIVDRKLYIYKCKICDMPRLFKMKYGSFIF